MSFLKFYVDKFRIVLKDVKWFIGTLVAGVAFIFGPEINFIQDVSQLWRVLVVSLLLFFIQFKIAYDLWVEKQHHSDDSSVAREEIETTDRPELSNDNQYDEEEVVGKYKLSLAPSPQIVGPQSKRYYEMEIFSETYWARFEHVHGKINEIKTDIQDVNNDWLLEFLDLFCKVSSRNPFSPIEGQTLTSAIASELEHQNLRITFYSGIQDFTDLPLNYLTHKDFGNYGKTLIITNGGKKYE